MFQTEPTNQEIVNKKPYPNKQAGYVAALITKVTIRQMHRKPNCERNKRF